jgi:AhpD family alkylhydroperoxidase
MPRLTDPDPASIPNNVREFLAALPPDPMVKMMSHSVGTVRPFIELARAQFTSLRLSDRSRELVILAVAAYTDCAFVAAQHDPMAHSVGVEESTRRLIRTRNIGSAELTPSDRALLRFTAEVVQQPRVSEETFALARMFLSEREVVEVIQLTGYYWSFGRIATTLDVEVTQVYGDEPLLDIPDGTTAD